MKVTFCGHGDTVISNELREWLHQTILAQIEAGADLFYLGGYGSFDRAAAAAVWEIKKTFPGIMSNRFSTCGSLFMYDWIISPL